MQSGTREALEKRAFTALSLGITSELTCRQAAPLRTAARGVDFHAPSPRHRGRHACPFVLAPSWSSRRPSTTCSPSSDCTAPRSTTPGATRRRTRCTPLHLEWLLSCPECGSWNSPGWTGYRNPGLGLLREQRVAIGARGGADDHPGIPRRPDPAPEQRPRTALVLHVRRQRGPFVAVAGVERVQPEVLGRGPVEGDAPAALVVHHEDGRLRHRRRSGHRGGEQPPQFLSPCSWSGCRRPPPRRASRPGPRASTEPWSAYPRTLADGQQPGRRGRFEYLVQRLLVRPQNRLLGFGQGFALRLPLLGSALPVLPVALAGLFGTPLGPVLPVVLAALLTVLDRHPPILPGIAGLKPHLREGGRIAPPAA